MERFLLSYPMAAHVRDMYSVLIIEDNERLLQMLADTLRTESMEVDGVRTAEEGLERLSNTAYDFILLDLKLPKVDGLEVLRQMKAHPQFCTVPVVILTTSSENSDIKTAYQLGVNSYIVKPVDFEKFVEVAEQIEIYWNVLNRPPD